jgi:hypothetical protein
VGKAYGSREGARDGVPTKPPHALVGFRCLAVPVIVGAAAALMRIEQ